MEELAEFAPSGNLRTPIKKARNEVNAILAEKKEKGTEHKYNSRDPLNQKLSKARKNLQKLERNKTRKNMHNSGVLDYIVVEGDNLEDFTDDVMKKMAEGYILQGGVSYNEESKRSPVIKYRQALVKSNKLPRNLLANNANLLHI
jgi:hypothetical protein